MISGRTCFFRVKLTYGNATAAPAGAFLITPPFVPTTVIDTPFPTILNDVSAGTYTAVGNWILSGQWRLLFFAPGAINGVGGANPFTWTSGDNLAASGFYEL
jgi:hypothetical protein